MLMFITFLMLTLTITAFSNKAYQWLVFFKEMFKAFVKDLMFESYIGSALMLLSLVSFILSIFMNSFFLQDFSQALSYFILLCIALFFYLDWFDNFFQQMMSRSMCASVISGKPVSKTYSIIISLPSMVFSLTILYILIYNLYDMGAKGAIYLSLDSNLSLRIGTHLPGWSVASPYCDFNAKSDNFYTELEAKMERMFTTYSYRYTWAFDMAPPEKHKVMSWLSDRMYWSVEYQYNRAGDTFDVHYWEVVSALMKLFPIDGQTFTTLYNWRHDEFTFNPEGHRTFPRLVFKFYHD